MATLLRPQASVLRALMRSQRASAFAQRVRPGFRPILTVPARYYSLNAAPKAASSLGALSDFNKTKVQNMQCSDHRGLPLLIAITQGAANRLKEIGATGDPKCILRVSVESGGCHGFQYVLKLTDMSEFDPKEDSLFTRNGGQVMMDKTSLEILRDSKIDYVHELIGSQFKVVDSPYSKSSCGCGSSFDIDFDKMNSEE